MGSDRGATARSRALVAGLLLGLLVALRAARAFELLIPDRGYYGPHDPLRIRLPEALPVAALEQLAVEIDGIDVTAFLRFEEGTLVYASPQPLAGGLHELRLLAYTAEGGTEELLRSSFEVRKLPWVREFEARGSIELLLARELAADARVSVDPKGSAQGAVDAAITAAQGEWRLEGRAGAMLDSRKETATGKALELSEYQVRYERAPLALRAGHFSPLEDSLISSGFGTRGLAADIDLSLHSGLRATLFAMRSEAITGFEDFFGIEEPDNRVLGGQLHITPLSQAELLTLTLTGYHGRGPTAGVGGFGDLAAGEAGGLALAARSRLLGGMLALEGEIARSWWDADGREPLADMRADEAWRLQAVLDFESGGEGDFASGSLAFGWVRAGPLFESMLGTSAQPGQDMLALEAQLQRGGLDAALTLSRAEDEAGAGVGITTSRLDSLELRLGYAFDQPYLGVLQAMSLAAGWSRRRPVDADAGGGVDERGLTGEAAFDFALGETGLHLSYAEQHRNDFTAADEDEITRALSLELERPLLGGRLVLTPSASLGWSELLASGDDVWDQELRLGLELAPLWRGRHGLTLEVYWNRSRDDSLPDETISYGLEGTLSIDVLEARANLPGLALHLSVDYVEERDELAGTRDGSFRMYATLSANWGISY